MYLSRNILFKIIIILVVFSSFVYINFKTLDPDLGWHLKVGEWILENQSVQRFDEYSYTMPGFEWVDHEWLTNIWFYWMYSKNLWWLLALVLAVIAFIPFLFWIKRSKNITELCLVFLAAILALGFFGVRPQVLSFLFFFLVLDLLYRQRHFFLLPLIFLIWANLHAGFFSGLLVFGVFVTIQLWGHRKSNRLAVSNLLIFFLLSIAATLINPHGWKIYQEIFQVAVFSDVSKYIVEWQPALSFGNLVISVFLGVFGFLVLKFYKQYPVSFLAISLIFLAMFLKSAKIGPLFLVTASPILALGVQFVKLDILAAHQKKPFSSYSITLFQTTSALTLASLFFLLSFSFKGQGFGYPDGAAAFLRDELQKSDSRNIRLFNDYGWGGYLIWNLPEVKVFIDGRMPHWVDGSGNSAMKDYVKVFYDKEDEEGWREVFERRGINLALVKNTKAEEFKSAAWPMSYLQKSIQEYIKLHGSQPVVKRVINLLREKQSRDLKKVLLENNWKILYEDDVAAVLVLKLR